MTDTRVTESPKARFIAALERKVLSGRVPHFELVFSPTMEAIGKVSPHNRCFYQWDQMTVVERKLQLEDIADTYIGVAEKYEHNAIFIHGIPGISAQDDYFRLIDIIRGKSDDRYFLMMHGDATYAIPGGNGIADFCYKLIDEPQAVKDEAESRVAAALERATKFAQHGGMDGFALCSDYCFNNAPFLSPDMFAEFITPYLKKLIAEYRRMDFYVIKHTDGNIMPILDQLLECNPHALHSLDPQGGIDIAEVKKIAGDKVCLIGNVNCGLMDTGSDTEIIQSAKYALEHGMPGGGYIFSTSNSIYAGMALSKYELIVDVWRKYGNYSVKK